MISNWCITRFHGIPSKASVPAVAMRFDTLNRPNNPVCSLPPPQGLEIFNTTSTAFLDAYAKNDSDARIYLQSGTLLRDTDGRAALTVE